MQPFLPKIMMNGSRLLRKDGVFQILRSWNEVGIARSMAKMDGKCESLSGFGIRGSIFDMKHAYNGMDTQRRTFLGYGDGNEGCGLSKVHEQTLLMGYSPEKLFAVVSAVDMYEDFLPWCKRSDIIQRYPNGSFDAELQIGFKFFVESYVSRVVLDKPKVVKTTSSQSTLFEHLTNVWKFNPGPTPETCNLYFLVDFKFHSPLYRQMSSMFFQEVVSRLVTSFNERCRLIYGPEARIPQNQKKRV